MLDAFLTGGRGSGWEVQVFGSAPSRISEPRAPKLWGTVTCPLQAHGIAW